MVRSLANSGPLDDEFFEKMWPKIRSYIRDNKRSDVPIPIMTSDFLKGDQNMAETDPPTFGWLAIKWFLAVCAAFAVMVVIAIGLS